MNSTEAAPNGAWRNIGRDAVSARVKGEILRVMTDQQLSAGDRLPSERVLAGMLGVSRPSVREAVQMLRAEGWLTVRHGAGIFVAEPEVRQRMRKSMVSPSNFGDLYDMREAIEVPASRWAAQRQLPAVSRVKESFDALEAFIESGSTDWDRLQQLDATFHTRIVQASGNTLLEHTQAIIYDMILEAMRSTLSVPGRLESSREQHRRILEAIRAGDGDGAARAALEHVCAARETFEAHPEELSRD